MLLLHLELWRRGPAAAPHDKDCLAAHLPALLQGDQADFTREHDRLQGGQYMQGFEIADKDVTVNPDMAIITNKIENNSNNFKVMYLLCD